MDKFNHFRFKKNLIHFDKIQTKAQSSLEMKIAQKHVRQL